MRAQYGLSFLQEYSTNVDVAVDAAVPFNNIALRKGISAIDSSPATIQLNRAGIYSVSVNGTASAATTIQLTKNGTPLPQAQSTGTNLSFETLIQVQENNTPCCFSSPTLIQLLNTGAAATFDNINIVVAKIC